MFSMIVAIAKGGAIGHKGKVPWKLPNDLKRFKDKTLGKKILVGRKTYEDLPSLPGRDIYVATQDPDFEDNKVTIVNDLEQFLQDNKDTAEEIFIAGGAAIYQASLKFCKKFYITIVRGQVEADTRFAFKFSGGHLRLINSEAYNNVPGHDFDFMFRDYEKVEPVIIDRQGAWQSF